MRFGLLLVLLLAALPACGSTVADSLEVGPSGPPSITLVNPKAGPKPACRAIGTNVAAHVPLLLDVANLLLRPPGGCAGVRQCGHLRLRANGIFNNEGAAKAIDLLLGKLANPYHDGSTLPGGPDVLNVEIDAVDDLDQPIPAANGSPLSVAAKLIIAPTCP